MFHELTYKEEGKRKKRRWVIVTVVLIVCVAVVAVAGVARRNARVQGAAALRESILSAAKQCASIEGAYPSSVSHLEESYGLTINHNDYIITYEWFADNIVPSVVVAPR